MNVRQVAAITLRFTKPSPGRCTGLSRFSAVVGAGTTAVRYVSSSADKETLAKAAEMVDALVGSTTGLNLSDIPSTTPTVQSSQSTTKPTTSALGSTADDPLAHMFVPPANDPLLDYLTSALQKNGHRSKATRLVSRTLLHIHTSTRAPPMPIVREAVLAVSPAVKLGSHKYGTKTLQVPYALTEKQRIHAGVKALLAASESRPGKSVDIRLARELIGVLQGESKAIVEKERLHRLAMVNR
ncbi:hypothetical protein ID866_2333 [Astraeus odoratus]|nr:hypothetical protein ID866_2333 [Astraeus odoratus]